MNIIIFSELMYPNGGGAELATWLYIKMLCKEGFNVTVITTDNINKTIYNYASVNNLKIYRLPKEIMKGTRYFTLLNSGTLLSHSIRRLIKSSDFVYIPGGWYSVIPLAKLYKKKIIVHLHNYFIVSPSSTILINNVHPSSLRSFAMYEMLEKNRKGLMLLESLCLNEYIGRYYSKLAALADSLICVSYKQAQIISEHLPELSRKIHVIYNPIPDDIKCLEKNLADNPTFIYVGGDSHIKGFNLLIKTIKKIHYRKNNTNVRDIKIIVTGNYSSVTLKLLYKLKKLGVNINVRGWVSHNELINLYSRCWALLFPSTSEEPLPYAVLEAAASGTLPIAARVGGVPEIVEGTPAEDFMFEPNNSDEMRKKILKVIHLSKKELNNISNELQNTVLRKINYHSKKILKLFSF